MLCLQIQLAIPEAGAQGFTDEKNDTAEAITRGTTRQRPIRRVSNPEHSPHRQMFYTI
jgi:hypothetical protein